MEKSRKKKKSNAIYTILIVFLSIVILVCLYQIVSRLHVYKKGNDVYDKLLSQAVQTVAAERTSAVPPGVAQTTPEQETPEQETPEQAVGEAQPQTTAQTEPVPVVPAELPYQNVDFGLLQQLNGDIKAWLQGSNTGINYPVVQGTDNDFYLTHLADGTVNDNGSLFFDYRKQPFSDDMTMIYGHHMKSGAMFGRLERYGTQRFYEENPVMRLYTPQATYRVELFAGIYTTGDETFPLNFGDEQKFNGYIKALMKKSTVRAPVTVSYGDRILCLYTCAYHTANGRYVVYGRLVNE